MKERGILFQAPLVRALLAGTKTQTRRLATHRHGIDFLGGHGMENDPECWGYAFDGPEHHGYAVLARGKNERWDHGFVSIPCPYGEPGDRLWVRETWATLTGNGIRTVYRADGEDTRTGWDDTPAEQRPAMRWRPSIFMPRSASRISLEVTEVRVQRLQAITEEDARAEGVTPLGDVGCPCEGPKDDPGPHLPACPWSHIDVDPDDEPHRAAFAVLWDAINGTKAPWSSNPWLWCVSFRVLP